MTKIFISYRRDDSADVAGRIYDWLVAHFRPENVFIDVDNIPPGVDFREHLAKSVQQCDVLLVLIGRHWLCDEQGRRRLDDNDDFVRIEIEAALRRKTLVIPVRLRGVKMPAEVELPDTLSELVFRNAVEIRHESFHQDLKRLVEALKQHKKAKSPGEERAPPAPPAIDTSSPAQQDTGFTLRRVTPPERRAPSSTRLKPASGARLEQQFQKKSSQRALADKRKRLLSLMIRLVNEQQELQRLHQNWRFVVPFVLFVAVALASTVAWLIQP